MTSVGLIAQSGAGFPASKVAGTDLGDTVVLDVDATIVIAHSEKERASATFKKTFGFHPIGVWCDNTGEFLAATLRTGKAGSNTAADHVAVLGEAIAQVPAAQRRNLLSDGAGASHQLLDWLTEQGRVRGRRLEYTKGRDRGVGDHAGYLVCLGGRAPWLQLDNPPLNVTEITATHRLLDLR